MPSAPALSWFSSALSRNAALHTGPHLFSPSFQRLHPHSFTPHPCSSPGPPCASCSLSPSSPITLTLLLAVLSHLPKVVTPPFPIPLPRSELPICFPLSLCIIPQSLSSHPVTVHMCFYTSQPVTADDFYFAGTHSELLPPCKSVPQLCSLLTCLQIPPAGSCFPKQALPSFLCPFLTLLMPFVPLASLHHYPVPLSSCPERFLPRNLLWILLQKAQLSSHHL